MPVRELFRQIESLENYHSFIANFAQKPEIQGLAEALLNGEIALEIGAIHGMQFVSGNDLKQTPER
jgi:hypothetical protein